MAKDIQIKGRQNERERFTNILPMVSREFVSPHRSRRVTDRPCTARIDRLSALLLLTTPYSDLSIQGASMRDRQRTERGRGSTAQQKADRLRVKAEKLSRQADAWISGAER